jgi:apolipoprotein N-acyltransferase
LENFYDKTHLLPFGEYLPKIIKYAFPNLSKITHGKKEYTPGIGPKNIALPGLPSFNPVICYESIFEHEIATDKRADFILVITNDAWFGDSWGPAQHFYQARVRAIEEGLPLIRVANTGKTAVVDARGRVLQDLPMNAPGVLVTSLPLQTRKTPFSALGLWASGLFGLLMFTLCYRVSRR